MSDEIIKTPTTSDNSLDPMFSYFGNKARVRFDGSYLKQDKTTFTHEKTVNIYTAYEIDLWPFRRGHFTSGNALFDEVKLVKNPDKSKYKYSGYGIGFDNLGFFSFPTSGFGKNVINFGADISSSSVHVDNKKKDILILGEGTTQGLGDTTLTAEKKYSVNFTEHNKKYCLALHYNEANRYSFVNGAEIDKFKAKDSEIYTIPSLENI